MPWKLFNNCLINEIECYLRLFIRQSVRDDSIGRMHATGSYIKFEIQYYKKKCVQPANCHLKMVQKLVKRKTSAQIAIYDFLVQLWFSLFFFLIFWFKRYIHINFYKSLSMFSCVSICICVSVFCCFILFFLFALNYYFSFSFSTLFS